MAANNQPGALDKEQVTFLNLMSDGKRILNFRIKCGLHLSAHNRLKLLMWRNPLAINESDVSVDTNGANISTYVSAS